MEILSKIKKLSNPILKFTGFALLILGTLLNIRMFALKAWPTYLFFIMMAVGLLLLAWAFFFNNIKTSWQLFIVSLPFVVAYILFNISSPSNDLFLITKGFKGPITVYYDCPDGEAEVFEGKWRVYEIPSSGKLRTKFKVKGNSIDLLNSKYFYVGEAGERLELKHYCPGCLDKDSISTQVDHLIFGSNGEGMFRTFSVNSPIDMKK